MRKPTVKTALILIAAAMILGAAGCRSRSTVYERKNPIHVESPASGTNKPWENGGLAEQTPEPTEEPPYIFTGYAFCVMNAATGETVLAENEDQRNYIASITKILTVLTALDYMSADENVTCESGWLDYFKKDGSIECYGIREGRSYNVGDVVDMALVRSFGDAAVLLGKSAERRSGRDFIELMNEKAAALGMLDSHFDNVIGLDIGNQFTENYSTAADAARLMSAALANETIMRSCSRKEIKLTNGTVLTNTSPFLSKAEKSDFYTVIGCKTGSTKASGSNLAVAVIDNKTSDVYVAVYLHARGVTVLSTELDGILEYVCAECAAR